MRVVPEGEVQMSEQMGAIKETVERVLRSSLAHIHFKGDNRATMEEQEEALRPYDAHIEVIMGMMGECLKQAQLDGANVVHQALHQMPGVDHEMLDETAAHAPADGSDDPVKL